MSFEPHFAVSHRITADVTRTERAWRFLEAATLSHGWLRKMRAHSFTEAGGMPVRLTRLYELPAGLIG